MSYIIRHINEGFNIEPGKKLVFTDAHEDVLNTSFDGEPTVSKIRIPGVLNAITVYSIFKRCRRLGKPGDSNPVLYALKKERQWSFKSEDDRRLFWNRFSALLKRFVMAHKGTFDTVIVVPSSKRLNGDIIDVIKQKATDAGINSICDGGLRTVSAESVLDAAYKEDSYFRKYWGVEFEDAYEELEDYVQKMEKENNGKFKYHIIDNPKMRKSVIHTLEIDDEYAFMYKDNINGKNIIIVDDSITHGQTLQNAIYAINMAYKPASISVLTMFSKLYDENGEEIK